MLGTRSRPPLHQIEIAPRTDLLCPARLVSTKY